MKTEDATLGFRVKSGWAAAILLSGSASLPRLRRSFAIDLCDPKIPATRQPYHAAMGKLETDAAKLRERLRIVRRVTMKSVRKLLADCRRNNFRIRRTGLVVGSQIDPALIANPHIRAHAREGELFRMTLVDALRAHGIRAVILTERDAYPSSASRLKKSVSVVRRVTEDLGRSVNGPWRAEQKLAALAAWIAL